MLSKTNDTQFQRGPTDAIVRKVDRPFQKGLNKEGPAARGSFTRPAVSRRQHSLRHGLLVALCALGLQTSPWWQLLRPLSPSFTVMLSKRNESIQQRIPVDSGWGSKCPYYWLCITDLIWFSSCWLSRSPPRPRGRKFINGKSEV